MVVFDIETDALDIKEVSTIHCIALKKDSEDIVLYKKDDLQKAIDILSSEDFIIGHNIIDYDIPVIRKFFKNFKYKDCRDTLILSRMLDPDRNGGHSLESYSGMFGLNKIHNEDWDKASSNIYERCVSDVQINYKLYLYLKNKIGNWNWEKAIETEHTVARIMHNQAKRGWKFDVKLSNRLIEKLTKDIEIIDKDISPLLKPKCSSNGTVLKPFKKDGNLCERSKKHELDNISGSYSLIEFVPINLSSEQQMKELLTSLGWVPTQWNFKKDKRGKPVKDSSGNVIRTSPKLTEDSYESLPEGLGQSLALRLKSEHRLRLVKGLSELVREDGRIESRVIVCGTNTLRMRHKGVVNIPKNDPKVFLGKEMRSLFICDEGRELVGCDASGLEWRIVSHFINRPEVTDLVLNGDIHEYISNLAKLNDRQLGKSVGYGILYGAGNKRVSELIKGSIDEGKQVRDSIIHNFTGLDSLLDRIEVAANRGFLKALDGRKVFLRSSHSALNALIQSSASIIMENAMILANKRVLHLKYLDAYQVGFFHDEFIFDCNTDSSKEVAKILEWSIIKSGELLGLRVPLNSEAKIGNNWSEIH